MWTQTQRCSVGKGPAGDRSRGAVRRGHADHSLCMALVLSVRGSWVSQDRGSRGSETWSHSRKIWKRGQTGLLCDLMSVV